MTDEVRASAKEHGERGEAGGDRGDDEGVSQSVLDVAAERVANAIIVAAGELVDELVDVVSELLRRARLDAALVGAGAPGGVSFANGASRRTSCRASASRRCQCSPRGRRTAEVSKAQPRQNKNTHHVGDRHADRGQDQTDHRGESAERSDRGISNVSRSSATHSGRRAP